MLPQSAPKIWAQLGMPDPIESVRFDASRAGAVSQPARRSAKSPAFFRASTPKRPSRRCASSKSSHRRSKPHCSARRPSRDARNAARFAIDDFLKVDLRVGLVLTAQPVKGSTKLMHMTVDIGEPQPRTIVAGIAEAYTPEQLVNRKVVIVANLQPRKLKGIESNGMIVAASVERRQARARRFPRGHPGGSAPEVKLVDSHCHLDDEKFDADREQVIERALAAGVEHMMAIGTAMARPSLADGELPVHLRHRRRASARSARRPPTKPSRACAILLRHPKVLAIGEIGLDYHYDFSPRDVQRAVFARQLGDRRGVRASRS